MASNGAAAAAGQGVSSLTLVPHSYLPQPALQDGRILPKDRANPWHDFSFLSTPERVSRRDGPPTLSVLPAELVLMVAERLPASSILPLSRTNRRIRDILQHANLIPTLRSLSELERWSVCLALERTSTTLIVCSHCLCCHLTGSFNGHVPLNCEIDAPWKIIHGRRNLNRSYCRWLLRQHGQQGKQASGRSEAITIPESLAPIMFPSSNRHSISHLRVRDGMLLLRTQTFYAPLNSLGQFNLRGLRMLIRAFKQGENGGRQEVCNHLDLAMAMHRNFQDWGQIPEKDPCSYGAQLRRLRKLTHSRANDENASLSEEEVASVLGPNMAREFFSEKPASARPVWGCFYCLTDFSVNFLDVEGVGRILVFTQWNDLGGPAAKWKWHWREHGRWKVPSVSLNFEEIERKGVDGDKYWVSSYGRYHTGAAQGFVYEPQVSDDVMKWLAETVPIRSKRKTFHGV